VVPNPGPDRALIRISDADRKLVASALSKNAAEGRLTLEELEERLGTVYSAKTYAELQPLLSDLPEGVATSSIANQPQRRAGRARGRRRARMRFRRGRRWSTYIRVNALCWAIWGVSVVTSWPAAHGHMAAVGNLEGLWPLWVTVPWGVLRLTRGAGRKQAPEPPEQALQAGFMPELFGTGTPGKPPVGPSSTS
jgi:hypothetical protein